MGQSRRVELNISINGVSASGDLAPYLKDFTFTDNAHGKADDIAITLHDRDGIWKNSWLPENGDKINVDIVPFGFAQADSVDAIIECGSFDVDELTASGFPNVISIKAVSVPILSTLRREKHSKTWEKQSLKQVAGKMAKNNGIDLVYESDFDPYYNSRYQHDESDLSFLQRMCEQSGFSIKLTDKQIVIFDELEYELKPAVLTISSDDYRLIGYSFTAQAHEVFKACTVRYHSSEDKDSKVYTYNAPNAVETGQILNIDERVESIEEAERLAKKRLREKNKYEITGTINLLGDTGIYAGTNFELAGFGLFNGKYHIDKVTHKVTGGYNVTIEFHRCVEF